MKLDNIDKMNTQEKLQAMDALWQALLEEGENIESPAWHGELLAERQKKIDGGTAKFITLDELKKLEL